MEDNHPRLPDNSGLGGLGGVSMTPLAAAGELEIAGRRYLTAERLATSLGITVRTLARWDAARIGPPKIKIGKLVLFDLREAS